MCNAIRDSKALTAVTERKSFSGICIVLRPSVGSFARVAVLLNERFRKHQPEIVWIIDTGKDCIYETPTGPVNFAAGTYNTATRC